MGKVWTLEMMYTDLNSRVNERKTSSSLFASVAARARESAFFDCASALVGLLGGRVLLLSREKHGISPVDGVTL